MATPNLVSLLAIIFISTTLVNINLVRAGDPYLFYTWDVKYATLSPLGVPQQVITINDQFPGPWINSTSNNNILVNIFNHLDEPLLFTWNGIQQRKKSWVEGTLGTGCPIMPGTNYTVHFQVKDQIGSYYYYPTTALHRSAGGYGPLTVHSRELIPVPFDWPEAEFNVLVGDWYKKSHVELKKQLDSGHTIGKPDGVIINGKTGGGEGEQPMFTMIPWKTYRFRVCNVGMKNSINVRIQGHSIKLVEIEGSHTVQNVYDSLDVHLGQCYSILVTADQTPKDYYLVASTRFTKTVLTTKAIIRYAGSKTPPSPVLPEAPVGWAWSLNQFRSFRWNLTASAARPNPQGSYHYGKINITRTIKLVNSVGSGPDGKLRYAINGVSHINPETPLKLAEYFGIADKVFKYNLIQDMPEANVGDKIILAPNVLNGTFRNFVEIIFENHEKSVQSWHMSGYSFFPVAIEPGTWSPEKRINYNLIDTVSRHTIQVYPKSWAAVMTTLDNAGMWSLRSVMMERQYLGQELYISIQSPERSLRDEYNILEGSLQCGLVKDLPPPKLFS